MKEFLVIYEGRVREVYSVQANTEEEAREVWSDFEPDSSEVIEGEVTEVVSDD